MGYDDKRAVQKQNIQKSKQQKKQPTEEESTIANTQDTVPKEDVKEVVEPTNNNPVQPTNNPDYTMNEVVSVEETGSLPQTEVKSNYDRYMQDALNIYNKGVDTNNKNAANQAAIAGAEYRELNRNIGEINKANGRANTGYAGDTSIDAYNAYRNSVNEYYQNADKANNDLYSYYLSEVTRLQQAKDAKEESDRIYQDQKETNIVSEVSGMLLEDGAFNNDGTITNETASKIWNYVNTANGGAVPDTTMAYLESQNGFHVAFSKKSVVFLTPIIWFEEAKPAANPPPFEF